MMKKGFTLIELLVVVAIIGILTSVALASLNTARTKGADAAIKDAMSQFRSQAEVLSGVWNAADGTIYGAKHDTTNGAVAACPAASTGNGTNIFNHPTAARIIANAASNAGKTTGDAKCATDGNSYVLLVPLRTSTSGYWCVDSAGAANSVATANLPTGATYTCPAL